MNSLPQTVRARRKELGLTLEEVAAIVGVTPGALSHIESGRRLPDPRNAVAIAQALQMDPDELLALLDDAHADRNAIRSGWKPSSESRSRATAVSPDDASVFRAMPIDAMFAKRQPSEPAPRIDASYDTQMLNARQVRSNVGASSRRDRARYAPASGERLRAAEELAEDASRAIRTLRGMQDDQDPAVAREARRLLVELGLRGEE